MRIVKRSVSRVLSKSLNIFQKVRTAANTSTAGDQPIGDIEHRYNKFSIILPADHPLPMYQKQYPKYDRFLPHLVKYLTPGASVIDVGANCGDSLANMFEGNCQLNYICIEPDDAFFDYLRKNIMRIREADPSLKVSAIKAFIGLRTQNFALEGTKGTEETKSLDSVVSELKSVNLKFIKIDVDGFDYDVINSAPILLTSYKPIIFFECYYKYDYQKLGFEKAILWLRDIGYEHWAIFDNFGEFLMQSRDVAQIFQMMEYIWKQNQNKSTRTIYYFDLLTATDMEASLIDAALAKYQTMGHAGEG